MVRIPCFICLSMFLIHLFLDHVSSFSCFFDKVCRFFILTHWHLGLQPKFHTIFTCPSWRFLCTCIFYAVRAVSAAPHTILLFLYLFLFTAHAACDQPDACCALLAGCLLGSRPVAFGPYRYSNVHRTFELRSCPHGFESLLFSYENKGAVALTENNR